MDSPLPDTLGTKLLIPRVRAHLVRRDRLVAHLNAGMHGVLTLLCAPAGYGKTTLLIDWRRSMTSEAKPAPAVAWLSLDEGDNDPVRFARFLVAALCSVIPRIGEDALARTQGPPPPLQTVFAALINDLAASPREIILILDSYHVIQKPAIHEAIAFLLEHLPPLLHVAIETREDPPLPLLSLRARGALCELRAADLRFTVEEAVTFLREVMGCPISADEAAALEARTEGWIAGLQLAALAMREEKVVSGFTAALGASHRYIADYLVAEVLDRQPSAVQAFLLRTSVLSQLSAPLCDAVLGDERPDGGTSSMLEYIERSNLFLVPLDAERRWYRYHQLFADLLRVRLRRIQPDLAPDLHRRASGWYEEHGFLQEAIQHALAASDPDRTACLIEQHGMAVFHLGQLQTILGWFRGLPADVMRSRPLLCIIHAYALGGTNQWEAAEKYLHDAEQHLQSDLPPDEAGFLRGRILLLRAVMAGIPGDLARSIGLAVEAVDLLSASDLTARTPASILRNRVIGDVSSASERALATAVEQAKAAGLPLAARVGLSELGRLYVLQGRLRRAAAVFGEAERTLGSHIFTGLPGYSFGLGDLLREWNDLDGAERVLNQGMESITETNIVDAYVAAHGYIALARLRQARGNAMGAMAALDDLVGLARRRQFAAPVLARAAAARARLWLIQGNPVAATHWADTSDFGPDDRLSYLREPEHLTLARVFIAGKREAALALLNRLIADAEAHGRTGSAIEILALRALAFQALGAPASALEDLERALALGEPEGYMRVFLDEGAPMATLLRRGRVRGIAPEYVARLLAAFGSLRATTGRSSLGATGAIVCLPESGGANLVEPLTKREREILGLLMTEASNQGIAERLFVSRGTVKKHIYHIFSKLGVKNRTQAIAKAKALRLS